MHSPVGTLVSWKFDAPQSGSMEVKVEELLEMEELLDGRIVRAVREMGFEKLSPIQSEAIPYLLEG